MANSPQPGMGSKWRWIASVGVVCLSIAIALLYLAPNSLLVSSGFPLLRLFLPSPSMSGKNVSVAGGTGSLGAPIVEELVKAGFNVTILTRDASKVTAPAGVAAVKGVDYTSVDSLKAALAGEFAVVSVLGSLAVGGQTPLIDAAVAAGVKRFIPSEFGLNTRNAQGSTIGKILTPKIKTVDYLIEKANASNGAFTWTGISTGLFFDWGLERGALGYDLKTKTATIYDSGNEKFPTSNLNYIGKVVVAVIKQAGAGAAADKTANLYIDTASFAPTQNELLQIVEAETGGAQWTIKHIKADDENSLGEEKLAKGDFSAFVNLLHGWFFKDGSGRATDFKSNGNALLGLEPEDPRAAIKAWLAKSA